MSNAFILCGLFGFAAGQVETQPLWKDGDVEVRRRTESDPLLGYKIQKNELFVKGIYHGNYFTHPAPLRRLPTTYYHPGGPVGFVFGPLTAWSAKIADVRPNDARLPAALAGWGASGAGSALTGLWSQPPIGVLGMASGTIAAYGQPLQTIHFYERDPVIAGLSAARDGKAPWFGAIADAQKRGALVKTLIGEHRAVLSAKAPKGFYQMLFLESYKGNIESVHLELFTKEGVSACMEALAPDGVLCIHVSNRYYNLAPGLGKVASTLGLKSLEIKDLYYREGGRELREMSGHFSSSWVLIARDVKTLDRVIGWTKARRELDERGHTLRLSVPGTHLPAWTDADASLAGYYWSDPAMQPIFDFYYRLKDSVMKHKGPFRETGISALWAVDDWLRAWDKRSARLLNRGLSATALPSGPGRENVVFRKQDVSANLRQTHEGEERVTMLDLIYRRINIGTQYQPEHADNQARKITSRTPTTYYHPRGPLGIAMTRFNWFQAAPETGGSDARLPVSVVAAGALSRALPVEQLAALWSEPPYGSLGLSAGTSAAYARPLQTVDFYERNPIIVELSQPAEGEPIFRYVSEARKRGANVRILRGEHRATLTKSGPHEFYHLLVVETYKRGVDDLHSELLTKEGMALCMEALAPDGVLCYHISDRYHELAPVVADVAASLGLHSRHANDLAGGFEPGHFSSEWVMVARNPRVLRKLFEPAGYREAMRQRLPELNGPYWRTPQVLNRYVWTDGDIDLRGLWRSDPWVANVRYVVDDVQSFLMDSWGMRWENARELLAPLYGAIEALDRAVVRRKNN